MGSRLGVPYVLFQSDAAVDEQAGATLNLLSRYAKPIEEILAAVPALRSQVIKLGLREVPRTLLRVVTCRERLAAR